jgi:hypothetical protein
VSGVLAEPRHDRRYIGRRLRPCEKREETAGKGPDPASDLLKVFREDESFRPVAGSVRDCDDKPIRAPSRPPEKRGLDLEKTVMVDDGATDRNLS